MNNCCLITANRYQRQDQWASTERRWTCLWQCYPEIYHSEELLGHFKTQWMAWCGSQTEMIWDHGVVVWASSLKLKENNFPFLLAPQSTIPPFLHIHFSLFILASATWFTICFSQASKLNISAKVYGYTGSIIWSCNETAEIQLNSNQTRYMVGLVGCCWKWNDELSS